MISQEDKNHPSPRPSPMGEGAICHPELVSGSQETIACHSEPTGEIIQPIIADGGQEVRKSSQFRRQEDRMLGR